LTRLWGYVYEVEAHTGNPCTNWIPCLVLAECKWSLQKSGHQIHFSLLKVNWNETPQKITPYPQAKQHMATPNSCICRAEHCWKSVCQHHHCWL